MLDALAESVRPADTLTIMFTTGSSGSPKGLCTHASAIGAGFLFYHGRSDDMFKVRGASVYPTEVEQALKTIGGVESALVTSITDDEGDHVAAFVVCDTATMPVGELRRSARAVLSSFKVRRSGCWGIPTTPSHADRPARSMSGDCARCWPPHRAPSPAQAPTNSVVLVNNHRQP